MEYHKEYLNKRWMGMKKIERIHRKNTSMD